MVRFFELNQISKVSFWLKYSKFSSNIGGICISKHCVLAPPDRSKHKPPIRQFPSQRWVMSVIELVGKLRLYAEQSWLTRRGKEIISGMPDQYWVYLYTVLSCFFFAICSLFTGILFFLRHMLFFHRYHTPRFVDFPSALLDTFRPPNSHVLFLN